MVFSANDSHKSQKPVAKTILEKLRWFFDSKFYPPVLIIAGLISHTFSVEIFGIIVVLSTTAIALFVCDNFKFLITPVVISPIMFSEKSVATGKYYDKPYITAMICGVIVLAIFIVAHFIIYKKHFDLKAFTKSKLLGGMVFLACAVLFNGCFSINSYHISNFTYALLFNLGIIGIFFIFATNLKKDKNLIKYVIYVFYLISIMITLEMFIAFTNQIQIVDGQIVKETIKVGWGMWNNIGGYLAFLLPLHFYYAATIKKFGWAFYLTGLASYFAIALTLSRSSLLAATASIIIATLITCFKGENKKLCRIFTIAIAVIGIIGIAVLWSKVSTLFSRILSQGLDDNGRFKIYEHGLLNYLTSPIFGGGFSSSTFETDFQFNIFLPPRYHNTFVQILATCGSVGIVAYLCHRYQTIKLFLSSRRLSTAFAALALGTLLSASMFDNHIFNIYPTMAYTLFLVGIERSIVIPEDDMVLSENVLTEVSKN